MKSSVIPPAILAALCGFAAIGPVGAQSGPLLSVCNTQPRASACDAVRGDRADGWAAQSRAEVMAPHGMVTTSQPLASQVGLQVLMNGGNAIDAAVATAAPTQQFSFKLPTRPTGFDSAKAGRRGLRPLCCTLASEKGSPPLM
jgi:hypothetical protein